MFSKLRGGAFFTCMALLAAASARGQDSAPIAKPLAPPSPSGEIIVLGYSDDAPLYSPGSNASTTNGSATTSKSTSTPNSSTPSSAANSSQPMSANEIVRRHLGTPEVAPPAPATVSKTAAKPTSGATKLPSEPTVSSGQVTTSPRNGSVSPSVAAAADPIVEPAEDATPRDSRPLAQRLKALRQPANEPMVEPKAEPKPQPKADSWDESAAEVMPSGPSARRAKIEVDTTAHPLSLGDPAAAQNLTPASPEPETSQAPAETFAPPAPIADSRPAGMHSSRRTVVNPEDLAVPEATAAAADNVLFKRQSPLLSVETTGPRTVVIGKEAVYTVTLSNGGDVAAQDLVVGVKIPDWTDVVGSQPSAGTTRPSLADGSEPFQWRLARLEAHGKETLALRLVPRKGRPFDLNVQWTFSPIASQTMVDVQEPKLVMNIAGPDEVLYGQSKLYRLTLSNPGTGKAENVAIDLWPVGNASAAPTRHPLGTLRAGESKVVELELTARQGGTVMIHAGASADPGLKTEATQEVLVRRAAVAVAIDGAKSRYAGTVAGYTIKVSNPGNAPAENVRVTAALPPEAKFTSATQGGQWKADVGKVIWNLPTLRPGEEQVLELRCTLSVPGANKLQVMSSASGDLNDMADIVTNVEALADLKLDVSDPAGPTAVGDEMVYELRVHNRGTKSAESVGVVAYFSEGIEPISAEGGTCDIANGVVAFRPLATLAVGGEVVYRIHARAEKTGKQMFRTEVECGTLGTKLVSAEEAMIYPNDGGLDLPRGDKAIAQRLPDPATPPATPERH
jgi:uncharacterized repeat protein (TIGR01451 family)